MLLAAAAHALAADAVAHGPQIAALPLVAPTGQESVLTPLDADAQSALQVCRADELGAEARAVARRTEPHHSAQAAPQACRAVSAVVGQRLAQVAQLPHAHAGREACPTT
ncbi:hypothetical protein ACQ4WX_48215 [Streptomyces lasalocidi]